MPESGRQASESPREEPFLVTCSDCGGEYHPDEESAEDHGPDCPVRRGYIKSGRWDDPADHEIVTDGGREQTDVQRANPDDVDRESVLALGECPNCGPKTLATVKVEDAEYVTSCSQCEYEQRAPVVVGDDGEPKVDAENKTEVGLDA